MNDSPSQNSPNGQTPGPGSTVAASRSPADEAREFALATARIAIERRCTDVIVLDLRGLSSIADYFVVGTGTSDRQMHAVLDEIEAHAKRVGRHPFKVSDSRAATWILADYVDVMVHLFDAEHRRFYDLDGLWGDGPRVPLPADLATADRNAAPSTGPAAH